MTEQQQGGTGGIGGEAVEKVSDAGIQKAGDAVEAKTGGMGTEQIEKGEQIADSKIGQ